MQGKLDESARGEYTTEQRVNIPQLNSNLLTDLRAALRIQPHNPEIQSELDAVNLARMQAKIKNVPNSPCDTGQSSEASGSSPSSSRINRPSPSPPSKMIPFDLTVRDKRRLKLIFQPLTVEIPGTDGQKESFAYPSWDRYDIKLL